MPTICGYRRRGYSPEGIKKFIDKIGYTKIDALNDTALFESAHAMKGVCANMGFDKMAAAAGEITEEFRPGNTRSLSDDEVKARIADIGVMYRHTVDGIRQYEQG